MRLGTGQLKIDSRHEWETASALGTGRLEIVECVLLGDEEELIEITSAVKDGKIARKDCFESFFHVVFERVDR